MIHRIIKRNSRSRAVALVESKGRALVKYVPRPVELNLMRPAVRRSLIIAIELFVGLLVVGAIVLGIVYYRLEQGNINLSFLVPSIEKSINGELHDISIKIEGAYVGKNEESVGVHFRLTNIVVYNKDDEPIANAPLAAVGLSARALLWGKIAPSQVVFIQPTLDMVYKEGKGISLAYGKGAASDVVPGNAQSDGIADLLSGMGGSSTPTSEKVQQVDFMKAITAIFEEARGHAGASSYLSQFGTRDAVMKFSQDGREYKWVVPEFIIDLKHSDEGSLIRGFGTLAVGEAGSGEIAPWNLRFQTVQLDTTKDLRLDVGFEGITPGSLKSLLPGMDRLRIADLPLSGRLTANFNREGEIQKAFANLLLQAGTVKVDQLKGGQVRFRDGDLKLAYSKQNKKIHILPSTFHWDGNQTILSGVVSPTNDGTGQWRFTVKTDETRLAAEDFGLKPMIVDELWVMGTISPKDDRLELANLYLRAGNAQVKLSGRVEQLMHSPGVYLDGQVATISAPVLKRLWPSMLGADTRRWVGERVLDGSIISGRVKVAMPPGVIEALGNGGDIAPEMLQLDVKVGEVVVKYVPDLIPVSVSQAKLKIRGRKFTAEAPKALVQVTANRSIRLTQGLFAIDDIREDIPLADLKFLITGKAPAFLSYLNQPPLRFVKKSGLDENALGGNVSGTVTIHMPLKKKVDFSDLNLKGDLQLVDLKTGTLLPGNAVSDGSIKISVTEKGVGGRGGIVFRGVPAKVNWQRIFGEGHGRQPPLRVSAELNNDARATLGLGVLNKYLKGDVPVVVTVMTGSDGQHDVQVRADLTDVRVFLPSMNWDKPQGSAAVLQFDVDKNNAGLIDLKNLSLVGKELVVEGGLKLDGETAQIASFALPKVSYKLLNSMSLSGARDKNGLFTIAAKVQSYDGRRILRTLASLGREDETGGSGVAADGNGAITNYDFVADIDRIVGDQEVRIDGAKLEARNRDGKIEWLDFKGQINNRSLMAVRIEREEDGRRYLKAESYDGGGTFRMLGLFPNIEGGQVSLKVDMEEKGQTEKSGTLWMKNFAVTGTQLIDPDAGQVDAFQGKMMGGNDSTGVGRARKIKTSMQFDKLKAPFSYGQGQFVLHDSYVNGPVIGATLRGKIDFRQDRMRLGGTYVPLYGLNSAIGEIPVLNELFVGRQGEGVFGVTFAIQGPIASPTMIINPVSLLAPGVFRQIFDFNNTMSDQQIKETIKKRQRTKRRPNKPAPAIQ